MASWKTLAFHNTRIRKRRSVYRNLSAPLDPPKLAWDLMDYDRKEINAFKEQERRARQYVQVISQSDNIKRDVE